MGTVIKSSKFTENKSTILKPIIYCGQEDLIEKEAVSISVILAEKLSNIEINRRTMQIEKCLYETILELAEDVVLKDLDVLFNPIYKVDILKVMISVCKKKSFSAIWPGSYSDNKLIYAEEGFLDYKIYNIKDYDVTCII